MSQYFCLPGITGKSLARAIISLPKDSSWMEINGFSTTEQLIGAFVWPYMRKGQNGTKTLPRQSHLKAQSRE